MDDTSDPDHKDCLFCRIARGEIPSRKVYEDDDILAFHDINPAAPVHFLIIPKTHLDNLYDADLSQAPLLGKIFGMAGPAGAGTGLRRRLPGRGQQRAGWAGRRCIIFTSM